MDCSDCVTVIEHSVRRLDGVLAINVNYPTEKIWVEFDNQRVSRAAIEKRNISLGYKIPAEGLRSWYQKNREVLFSLIAGLFLLIGWLGGTFFRFPALLGAGFYLAAYVFGGWDISRHAWHAIKERHFDTDLLMVMAALGAAFLGDFAEGALLLFLFSLGHTLEERALVIVLPPLFGFPFRESFLRAMTLLVAASPCALALGTPATILAGVAQAARNGVLIKGGAHLENLGRLKAIAFDKTGTITHGQPEVTDITVFGRNKPYALSLAAGAESRSAHPLARAVIRAAQTQGAPALANATVGIAMGGAGTDVALETADVALMGDDLSRLPFAVGLGRATRAIIVQNLFISLGVITLLIITSLTGIVSIGIAVVFHEGSTLVVVANALRLLGYKGQKG